MIIRKILFVLKLRNIFVSSLWEIIYYFYLNDNKDIIW